MDDLSTNDTPTAVLQSEIMMQDGESIMNSAEIECKQNSNNETQIMHNYDEHVNTAHSEESNLTANRDDEKIIHIATDGSKNLLLSSESVAEMGNDVNDHQMDESVEEKGEDLKQAAR
eukprot:TRINITY_DN3945_c0_g1_i3.p1 TRINITY_DN3945_c0_g1~~TRINITY_DN3945_c0_g1_i3.p1  ORF type:complete len:118 (-),score=31.27 TRINITY_DN3945_c0_g1_i3:138-491(-)